MVRLATIVAFGVLLVGGACRKPSRDVPPPVRIVPERCNERDPRVQLETVRRKEVGKPPPLWDYLLDLRVRVGTGRWLLVDETYFPEHVHEVARQDEDLPGWMSDYGWSGQVTPVERPLADPQVDWRFEGDRHHVTARLLAGGGNLLVKNVQATTTKEEHRVSVVLMAIDVDGLSPPDWIARGGPGNHRSIKEKDAVPTSTWVDCVDWLELGAAESD